MGAHLDVHAAAPSASDAPCGLGRGSSIPSGLSAGGPPLPAQRLQLLGPALTAASAAAAREGERRTGRRGRARRRRRGRALGLRWSNGFRPTGDVAPSIDKRLFDAMDIDLDGCVSRAEVRYAFSTGRLDVPMLLAMVRSARSSDPTGRVLSRRRSSPSGALDCVACCRSRTLNCPGADV